MAAALQLFVLSLVIAAATADLSPTGAPVGAPAYAPAPTPAGHPYSAATVDAAAGNPATNVIADTCALAKTHEELCIEALSSEPPSHRATKEQLASIMLRLAARNATENLGYIIGLADQSDAEPNLQQCLTDCIEQYQDAIEQVKDALVALDDAGYQDAINWILTGMSDVKVCQEGCKEVAEHKNVLTKRNGNFNRLCSIAMSIIRSLM